MPGQPLKTLKQAAKCIVIGAVVLYAGDWSIFQIRMVKGAGMETVPVEQYLKTPLKGDKLEYNYMGIVDTGCSKTLFPQYSASTWNPPCWWLRKHRTEWK